MPELPEVQIIVDGLKKKIVGKKIVDFLSCDKKVIQFKKEDVVGKKIENIERYAKIIAIHLDSGKSLLTHLKMTGQFIWEPDGSDKKYKLKKRVAGGHPDKAWHMSLPTKHTRGVFNLNNKSTLYFNDVRRFGWIKLCSTEDIINAVNKVPTKQSLSGSRLECIGKLKDLGVDPFSKEFTADYLAEQAKRFSNKKIKLYLMDQSIIAGIGNIYANEALYFAGIRPTRSLKNIKKNEWQKIAKSSIKALNIGLKYGGTSDDNYVNADGVAGSAQDHLKVYRREGERCFKCDSKIVKIKMGGRGTFYCPTCQS